MSFEIDGKTWIPESAIEHANSIIEKINKLLQENNITDDDGTVLQLSQNYSNALYLLSLGDGARFADNDAKLSEAINSFNVELCNDTQLENLLPIAAVSRNPGSYSTLRLTVTASTTGTCKIPAGTKAPYNNVNFVTQTDVVISAGATQVIDTICDTLGPVAVLTGEVTAFEGSIANLESVENLESSVPGVTAESISELRERIIAGDTIKYSLDGCKAALEELTGISYARIYFNYNTSETITLAGGVVLQPRTAYIVVHGSSDELAKVYAEYMSAPTQNSPIAKGSYSTVNVTITAGTGGKATIPATTTVTYNGIKYKINAAVTINATSSATATFTATTVGANSVPAYGITALDQTITNVESVTNRSAAIPGTNDPKHVQNWITDSGQAVPVYYDDAQEKNIFVKVYLKADAEDSDQIENQIRRDLIVASAKWRIGEAVTQLLTSAPFVDCTYTDVAYTEVSTDGTTWMQIEEIGCNIIPRVSDGTITIEQLGDE